MKAVKHIKTICTTLLGSEKGYLDPGTLNVILQALAGAAIGGLITLRVFWGRVSNFLKTRFSKNKEQ